MSEDKDGIYHLAWAVDLDGASAGAYESRTTSQGRIDLRDPSGKLTLTINTGSYLPQHVGSAPDGSFWTVGYIAQKDASGEDFNVLHHYTRTGQELSQALLWSQIAGDHNSSTALQALLGGRRLFIANDRMGFEYHSHYGHSTWIELSSTGDLLRSYHLGDCLQLCHVPVAMTAGGTVYAASYSGDTFLSWAAFNRLKGTWRELAGYPKGKIIGSDGEDPVFARHDGAWTILQPVSSGSLKPSPPLVTDVALSKR